MAKKRKKNYRLRKSVRRTLGALFMISAIVIAAIPFPDAAATDGVMPIADPPTSVLSYSVTDTSVNSGINLDATGIASGSILPAYGMRKSEEGVWQLQEQFTYYVIDKGAIMKTYNNTYTEKDVDLPTTINTGTYVEVDDDRFLDYFKDSNPSPHKLTLEYDNLGDKELLAKFEYYYPGKYLEYQNNITTYEPIIKNTASTPEEVQAAKDSIKVTGNPVKDSVTGATDLRKGAEGEYFCDYVLAAEPGGKDLSNRNFTMTAVEKPTASGGKDVKYIPQAKDPSNSQNTAGMRIDNNGFLYSNTTAGPTLVGIGKGAFSGVQNIESLSLKLPESIIYIADEAFMNSYVQHITLKNVAEIGNRAFQGSQLKTITWNESVKVIGTEAFKNTQLESIELPYSVTKIGQGAFANNSNLKTITFNNTNTDLRIEDFAFYECTKLGNQNLADKRIVYIGKGAFAIGTLDEGTCTNFVLPNSIVIGKDIDTDGVDETQLGDYIFYNRSKLQDVVMPNLLGSTENTELPEHTFDMCIGLKSVTFPDSCGFVSFDETVFQYVGDKNFYVRGPQNDNWGNRAKPRESTWKCKMQGGISVPYVYSVGGKEFYEVCKDDYLLLIDKQTEDTGILQSCEFITTQADDKRISLEIPGEVGSIYISGIASGCFSSDFLKHVKDLSIKDGGKIAEISDSVFAGATNMETAYVGDSVQKIGNEAFMGCTSLHTVTLGKNVNQIGDRAFKGCYSLNDVIFKEPDDLSVFPVGNIGSEAFSTNVTTATRDINATKLTFTGAIGSEYGPFAWAMDPANYVDQKDGVRVCYKTPAPTNLTVILDNANNLATLIDYPHYDQIDSDIRSRYESGGEMTREEQNLVHAALNVVIPDGVESIDTKGYLTGTSKKVDGIVETSNTHSIGRYFSNLSAYEEGGAFKGDTNLETITLNSVKYLPEHVFDGCTKLQTAIVGSGLTEIESLPFINCPSMTRVDFDKSTPFKCENAIIYETNPDGSGQTIVQCLASRGLVGSQTIDLNNDPELATTTAIRPGAFSNCNDITTFDLTGVSTIRQIPMDCFDGCTHLTEVDLPKEVVQIADRAFATDGYSIKVIVRSKNAGLASDVFAGVQNPKLVSYADTSVRYDAELQGADISETLGETLTFKFYYYNGTNLTLIKTDEVEYGGEAEPPRDRDMPKIPGKEFDRWDRDLTNITEDGLFTIAIYIDDPDADTNNPGTNDPGTNNPGTNVPGTNNPGTNDPGTNNPGTNDPGTNNPGTNDPDTNNPDTDKPGTNVNGGIDTDGDGIPDVDENGNKLYKLTVTNGEGSGYYPAGKTVTIKAGNAPKGTTFAYWSCSDEDLIFDDRTDWITTLTMISSDVTVICNFTGQYTLEVEYGSGSGSYPAGAKVAISAVEAPQGRKFASWVTKTNGLNVENSKKETTVITMPASHAKITATYMDTGSISGNSTPSKNNTSIVITKPGISDKNEASAYVSGSTDNFVVKISESLEAADEVQKALQKKYSDMSRIKYFAMDISLYDAKGVNKITNTNGLKVNITIPIPDALREYAGNNRVGAVVNGNLETLNPKFTTINGVPSVTFTATHFSPYTIYVDTGNMTVSSVPDSNPKTGDGIHPKWFLSIGLACISIILFTKKDRRYTAKAYR